MYICYLDESGTPQIPGTTSHYVLAGISIPVWHWRDCDNEIRELKRRFDLLDSEIHTGWLIRDYREQSQIKDFEKLGYPERRREVEKIRLGRLLQLQGEQRKTFKKYVAQTEGYSHLTFAERKEFVLHLAKKISGWGFSRLFAECIDKVHFDPSRSTYDVDEQAFEQVITRFQTFLSKIPVPPGEKKNYGILIHDNNPAGEANLTELMKRFQMKGTLWRDIDSIIEIPLFVDSKLTGMVQVADFCAYTLRRYVENQEEELFDSIFQRADRYYDVAVGTRHFTDKTCRCKICQAHSRAAISHPANS
jgi:hypothetical protein